MSAKADKPKGETSGMIPNKFGRRAPEPRTRTRTGVPVYPLVPRTVEECWQMAKYFSESGLFERKFPGQPGDQKHTAAVFATIQAGAAVGMPPPSALSVITVIDGKLAMYGDGQLSIVRNSGELEYIRETFDGKEPTDPKDDFPDDFAAVCTVKRVDQDEVTEQFTVLDAKRAMLWGKKTKSGGITPWVTHPKRMLKYRIRAFTLRDQFGDCLLGLQHSAEELIDMGDLVEAQGIYAPAADAPAERPERGVPAIAMPEEEPEAPAATFVVLDNDGNEHEFTDPETFTNYVIGVLEGAAKLGALVDQWAVNVTVPKALPRLREMGRGDLVEKLNETYDGLSAQAPAGETKPEGETRRNPDAEVEADAEADARAAGKGELPGIGAG